MGIHGRKECSKGDVVGEGECDPIGPSSPRTRSAHGEFNACLHGGPTSAIKPALRECVRMFRMGIEFQCR
jgi:hypothetical protein